MSKESANRDRTTTPARDAKPGRSLRRYRPDLESLESVCLLNAALPAPHELVEADEVTNSPARWTWPGATWPEPASGLTSESVSGTATALDAWDVALADHGPVATAEPYLRSADSYGQALAQSGFGRISKYLGRTWRKAGIDSPQDEDCTQSVYVVLLERWGRDRFEDVATEVARSGLDRLTDRTDEIGLDFLRALDQVKKQAQRQRRKDALPLTNLLDQPDGHGWTETPDQMAIGKDLEEIISASLPPREADLIKATIAGDSPAEIAARWGVSAKTVSNVKSEVIGKLRANLADQFELAGV